METAQLYSLIIGSIQPYNCPPHAIPRGPFVVTLEGIGPKLEDTSSRDPDIIAIIIINANLIWLWRLQTTIDDICLYLFETFDIPQGL